MRRYGDWKLAFLKESYSLLLHTGHVSFSSAILRFVLGCQVVWSTFLAWWTETKSERRLRKKEQVVEQQKCTGRMYLVKNRTGQMERLVDKRRRRSCISSEKGSSYFLISVKRDSSAICRARTRNRGGSL